MLFEEMLTVERWFGRKKDLGSAAKAAYRVYVKSPSEVPKGKILYRGDRGGMYYETDTPPAAGPEQQPERKPEPKQTSLDLFPDEPEPEPEPEPKEPEPETKGPKPAADMDVNECQTELLETGKKLYKLYQESLKSKKKTAFDQFNDTYMFQAAEDRYKKVLKQYLSIKGGGKHIHRILNESLGMSLERNVTLHTNWVTVFYQNEKSDKIELLRSMMKSTGLYAQGYRFKGDKGIKGISIPRSEITNVETFVELMHLHHTTPVDGDIYRTTERGRKKLEEILQIYETDITELEDLLERIAPFLQVYLEDPMNINLKTYLNLADLPENTGGTHIGNSTSININQAYNKKRVEAHPYYKGGLEERNLAVDIATNAKGMVERLSPRSGGYRDLYDALMELHFGPGGHGGGILHAIAHELGHVAASADSTLIHQLEVHGESRFVTPYSMDNLGKASLRDEAFAECFALYMTHPDWLKQIRPQVHRWFTQWDKEVQDKMTKRRAP